MVPFGEFCIDHYRKVTRVGGLDSKVALVTGGSRDTGCRARQGRPPMRRAGRNGFFEQPELEQDAEIRVSIKHVARKWEPVSGRGHARK
jgi:hypothetical protein